MKFSVATIAAFAAVALARPKFTNNSYQGISEGKPFTLTWDSAEGAVKIELYTGSDPNNLKPVRVLTTTTGASGSFTFTPSDLPTGPYAFRITDESGDAPNFSESFDYTGTAVSSSVTSASASRTSTSSAASSTQTETETETESQTESQTSTSTASGSTTTSATRSMTTTFTTTASSSSTRTSAPSATAPPPVNTNNGQRFGSSLALVLGTAIALIFFN